MTILAGGKGEPHGATTEDLMAYYRARGIAADLTRGEVTTTTPRMTLKGLASDAREAARRG